MEDEFYIYPYPEGYDQFIEECYELEELFWKERYYFSEIFDRITPLNSSLLNSRLGSWGMKEQKRKPIFIKL